VVPATEKTLSPYLRIPESVHRNLLRLVRSELLIDLDPLVGKLSLIRDELSCTPLACCRKAREGLRYLLNLGVGYFWVHGQR
jgi:hypothetical protein